MSGDGEKVKILVMVGSIYDLNREAIRAILERCLQSHAVPSGQWQYEFSDNMFWCQCLPEDQLKARAQLHRVINDFFHGSPPLMPQASWMPDFSLEDVGLSHTGREVASDRPGELVNNYPAAGQVKTHGFWKTDDQTSLNEMEATTVLKELGLAFNAKLSVDCDQGGVHLHAENQNDLAQLSAALKVIESSLASKRSPYLSHMIRVSENQIKSNRVAFCLLKQLEDGWLGRILFHPESLLVDNDQVKKALKAARVMRLYHVNLKYGQVDRGKLLPVITTALHTDKDSGIWEGFDFRHDDSPSDMHFLDTEDARTITSPPTAAAVLNQTADRSRTEVQIDVENWTQALPMQPSSQDADAFWRDTNTKGDLQEGRHDLSEDCIEDRSAGSDAVASSSALMSGRASPSVQSKFGRVVIGPKTTVRNLRDQGPLFGEEPEKEWSGHWRAEDVPPDQPKAWEINRPRKTPPQGRLLPQHEPRWVNSPPKGESLKGMWNWPKPKPPAPSSKPGPPLPGAESFDARQWESNLFGDSVVPRETEHRRLEESPHHPAAHQRSNTDERAETEKAMRSEHSRSEDMTLSPFNRPEPSMPLPEDEEIDLLSFDQPEDEEDLIAMFTPRNPSTVKSVLGGLSEGAEDVNELTRTMEGDEIVERLAEMDSTPGELHRTTLRAGSKNNKRNRPQQQNTSQSAAIQRSQQALRDQFQNDVSNIRASQASVPSVTPNASNVSAQKANVNGKGLLHTALEHTLEKAKQSNGSVSISIQLGMVFWTAREPEEIFEHCTTQRMRDILLTDGGFRSLYDNFTSVLTSSKRDIDALLQGYGVNLESTPLHRDAYYEVLCESNESCDKKETSRFVVPAIKGNDQYPARALREVLLGAAYIHYPEYAHDARLITTVNEEEVCPSAELIEIMRSVRVVKQADMEYPSLEATNGHALDITVVRLNSVIRYLIPGCHSKLYIEVRRIQEAPIKQQTSFKPTAIIASMLSDPQMIDRERLWFEVSIGCAESPTELQFDKSRRSWEPASYDAAEVASKIPIGEMASYTEKLICSSDGVGMGNHSVVGKRLEDLSYKKKIESNFPAEFW